MLLIYLLVLGTVAKGIVATDPTTHATTNDENSSGPFTTSASFDSTSTPTSDHTDNGFTSPTAFTTNSTASVQFTTTESVMTESTSLIPTTTPSSRLTDTSATSEAAAGNETDNSSLTTSSPSDFPSTPTGSNGATTITTNPENGQSTVTSETANTTILPTQDNKQNSNDTTPTTDSGNNTTQTPHDVSDSTLTTHSNNTVTGMTVLTTTPTKPTEPVTTSNSSVTTVSPILTTNATTVTNLQTTESTSSTTTAAPLIPTAGPPIVCPFKPCPFESTCLNGTCQCISGTFMVDGVCQRVQAFPGQLHLTSKNFSEEMTDRTSAIFQSTSAEITSALSVAFQNVPGYLGSDVVELRPGSVIASVNNNFENTSLTQANVNKIIQKAIVNSTGILDGATFADTNVCENVPLACDLTSTTCSVQNGIAVCSCKEGFIPIVSLYSNDRSCRACPSGQRAVKDKCEPCAFGYSGFNCNDSALLAVVVISCVLGGVLLLLVLALLIYCCWRCCSKDKSDYESSPYSSGDLNQPWPTGITPIPRATTNWDSGAAIEMTEGGSTNNLVDKKHQTNGMTGSYDLNPEDMKTFKGKNTSRYSYLVQGHENPYFLPGDDRKS